MVYVLCVCVCVKSVLEVINEDLVRDGLLRDGDECGVSRVVREGTEKTLF